MYMDLVDRELRSNALREKDRQFLIDFLDELDLLTEQDSSEYKTKYSTMSEGHFPRARILELMSLLDQTQPNWRVALNHKMRQG